MMTLDNISYETSNQADRLEKASNSAYSLGEILNDLDIVVNAINAILKQSLRDSADLLTAFYSKESNVSNLVFLSKQLAASFQEGNKILICGNGGSACDAMHFAEEFTGRFRKDRRALP